MNVKKLEEVCDFISGLWTGKKPPYVNVGVIRNTNFHKSGNLNFSDIAQLEVEVKQFSTRQLKFGDVVLEKSGGGPKQPVGRVCVFEKEDGLYSLSNFTSAIRVKNPKELDYKYLHYYLKHLYIAGETEKIQTHSTGIRNLQLSLYKDFLVPLPPLSTQKKIVAKLDAIFAEIDKATAAAEANAKNAEALFQSYLTEIFERGGEDWFELRLQDLLDKGWIVSHLDGNHGGDYPRKEEFISSGVPYISANCLDGDVLDLSKSKFLSKERASKLRKGLAKTDDVLFAHNATVGPVSILKTTEEVTILGTSLTYYRCNKDFIEPEYLANYMRSAKFKNQYLTIMRQSTRNQIPITKQREFFHVIPPLEQQKELLKKFNIFLSMKTFYESKTLNKINELFLLKQSILQKAFAGELVKE